MEHRLLPWHEALSYALLGTRHADLGCQPSPDPDGLVAELIERYGGERGLAAAVVAAREGGLPWPRPLPEDLANGLGPAQYWAALLHLRARLEPRRTAMPTAARPLTADERRLTDDAPPHHLG